MEFIVIDPHTNKFTCGYRDEHTPAEAKKGKWAETFGLNGLGLSRFYETLTADTYVPAKAAITTFSFVRLIEPFVKEVIVANTYELKQISPARVNTDKIDAGIPSRILKTPVLSCGRPSFAVTVLPVNIQELRGLFTAYRLYKKQITQIKNRIHSLLKEKLYGFTREEIFDQKSWEKIRELEKGTVPAFRLNELPDYRVSGIPRWPVERANYSAGRYTGAGTSTTCFFLLRCNSFCTSRNYYFPEVYPTFS